MGGLRYTYYNQDVSLGLNATSSPFAQGTISRDGNFFSASVVDL